MPTINISTVDCKGLTLGEQRVLKRSKTKRGGVKGKIDQAYTDVKVDDKVLARWERSLKLTTSTIKTVWDTKPNQETTDYKPRLGIACPPNFKDALGNLCGEVKEYATRVDKTFHSPLYPRDDDDDVLKINLILQDGNNKNYTRFSTINKTKNGDIVKKNHKVPDKDTLYTYIPKGSDVIITFFLDVAEFKTGVSLRVIATDIIFKTAKVVDIIDEMDEEDLNHMLCTNMVDSGAETEEVEIDTE